MLTATHRSTVSPRDPQLFRLASAARALDMSVETLRQHIRRGNIRALRVGRAVYLTREDLERFITRIADGERVTLARPPRHTASEAVAP